MTDETPRAHAVLYVLGAPSPVVVTCGQDAAVRELMSGKSLVRFTLALEDGAIYVNPAHVACVAMAREASDAERARKRIALA